MRGKLERLLTDNLSDKVRSYPKESLRKEKPASLVLNEKKRNRG